MKYFFNCLPKIKEKMQKNKNCILMFDFDGTLSKIAKTPKEAFLKKSTKNLLKKISENFYAVIISGRALPDIKNKIKLSGLIYAGSHGLEWQIKKEKKTLKINPDIYKKLPAIKKKLKKIIINYPGAIIEDKLFALAIHYRQLNRKMSEDFLKKAAAILNKEKLFCLIKGKKVIELRPKICWNKGIFVNFLIKHLQKKNHCSFSAFYIGDDKTDETAFKVLQKGVTVRMGRREKSSARYFIKTNEIDKLLLWLYKKNKWKNIL